MLRVRAGTCTDVISSTRPQHSEEITRVASLAKSALVGSSSLLVPLDKVVSLVKDHISKAIQAPRP